jgi:hypothetical protein
MPGDEPGIFCFWIDATQPDHRRHCEERRDEAIQLLAFWIASLRSQ